MNDWPPPPTPAQALASYTGKGPAYTVPNINGRVIHPTDDNLDPDVAHHLADTSPQLFIESPTLIRCPDSSTGWLLVTPGPPPPPLLPLIARPDHECRAIRWNGDPRWNGPHPPHAFTYGPNGVYIGHCGGRT